MDTIGALFEAQQALFRGLAIHGVGTGRCPPGSAPEFWRKNTTGRMMSMATSSSIWKHGTKIRSCAGHSLGPRPLRNLLDSRHHKTGPSQHRDHDPFWSRLRRSPSRHRPRHPGPATDTGATRSMAAPSPGKERHHAIDPQLWHLVRDSGPGPVWHCPGQPQVLGVGISSPDTPQYGPHPDAAGLMATRIRQAQDTTTDRVLRTDDVGTDGVWPARHRHRGGRPPMVDRPSPVRGRVIGSSLGRPPRGGIGTGRDPATLDRRIT